MNTYSHYKLLLCAGLLVLSASMVINANAQILSSKQLANPRDQGRRTAISLASPSKDQKMGSLLKPENIVNPAAFGDSYSLAPWLMDNLNQFYYASSIGAPTAHTFDGTDESGGGNAYGSVGGSFNVTEGIIDLGGGVERYVVEVTAIDSALDNEPWVDSDWLGEVFTSWILDVGTIDGGSDAITPGYSFTVLDSGVNVLNSAGALLASLGIYDTSNSTELSGSANLGLNGDDIAGFDLSTLQMYWDIVAVGDEADLALQLIDVTDGEYAAGDTIDILNLTRNIGGGVSTAYTITFYISTDTTITPSDILLGYNDRDPLDPGTNHYYQTSGPLPDDLPDGNYYIGAILTVVDADPNNHVNYDAVPIGVGSDPDISISPLSLDFVQELAGQEANGAAVSEVISRPKITQDTLTRLSSRIQNTGNANLIVGLNLSVQPEGKLSVTQAEEQHQGIRAQGNLLAGELNGLNAQIRRQFATVPFMALTADQATLDYLTRSPLVASITEDRISKVSMASSNPVIGSPVAWAEGYDGSGWAVAVLDTGVDNTHSWFNTPVSKVVAEACYGTNEPGFFESWCPGGASSSTAADSGLNCDLSVAGCDHGTHVAGTVAGNDETGPNFGVARGADIIAMQVFSKFLTEDDCGAGQAPCTASFSSDQIAAMERVLELAGSMDIAAVNMSLGGGEYSDQASCDEDNVAVKAAIENLRSVGIATVIAAGNDGSRDSISAPGCISNAISVGATTDSDAIASFSNIYPQIHLLAPGVSINSSIPGDNVGSKQGTSMSTPHIAGAWAVMKQINPNATVSEVLSALQSSATLVDDLRSGGIETGMPRINLDLAIGEPRTTFGVRNDGPVDLSVTSITRETAAPWISWSPEAPFGVQPGELVIVSVMVDYNLAPDGLVQTRLLVNSNDPDESPYPGGILVNVTRAAGSEPEFSSTPEADTTLTFGNIVTNTTSNPALVSVDNLGTADLTLVCNISGPNASQFNLVACPSPVIAAGSTNLSVTCEPDSLGLKQASLDVATNDTDEAQVSYPLTCTGIDSPLGDFIFADSFEGGTPVLVPDLVVVSPAVSNANLVQNQAYTINATARNEGDGDSATTTLRYYLSNDNVIATDDTPLGTDAIPGLAPAADSAQNLATTAPGVNGNYWVGACVDTVAGEVNTANQCSIAVQITVVTPVDSDNDRLFDSAETNTGIYIDASNTGTNPNNPDTDGDGIKDGDEVLGTLAGLNLPAMGTNPLRKDLLLEYDWFNDSNECSSHTHRPSATAIAMATAAFSTSPVANPGITNGVNLISDYGQGGVFTGGNLISDADGVIAGGVSGSDFLGYKAANFAANRHGYFHYVLLPHRYDTNSSSSGQAELPGDDLIVSLYCANNNSNVANTILHEVGHNLNLHHGGNEACNYKPNYNSVMNYKYQFSGIDNDCTPSGNGVLSFSVGDRISLNENSLNENNGTCGPGFPYDWNGVNGIESLIAFDINPSGNGSCNGTFTTLTDYNDWNNLLFGGIGDADGAPLVPREIITEQPVPVEFQNVSD